MAYVTGGDAMTMTVRAVYEGGVLRPAQPLAIAEGQTVDLTITPATVAPQLSEEEIICRIKAAKSYSELFEVTKLLPPDDGGYDILKALDDNRRWSGERPLLPAEGDQP
jgi:predicted DNA-binding antitoxin AbrB/MazE fold protein